MMSTVPMLSMSTKTLHQWWPLCQCWLWPPKHCANNVHCANVEQDHQSTVPMMTTVPMLTRPTKTLCQWWPLYQRCPWPSKHCANDDHCTSAVHDHQNTVPIMPIVPMSTRVTKAPCQWWPATVWRALWTQLGTNTQRLQLIFRSSIWMRLSNALCKVWDVNLQVNGNSRANVNNHDLASTM